MSLSSSVPVHRMGGWHWFLQLRILLKHTNISDSVEEQEEGDQFWKIPETRKIRGTLINMYLPILQGVLVS